MDKCPKCKNPEIISVQYHYTEPEHYDGVSEYRCSDPLCGYREGRWSGKQLRGEECEKRFGGK